MAFEFEESQKDRKQDIQESIWVVIWGFIAIMAGYFALTKGHGFDEQRNFIIFALFGIMILAFMILALGIKFAQFNGFFKNVYMPVFDPEKGLFPIKSGLKFLFGVLLFVSILGLISSFIPQSTFRDFAFPLSAGVQEQTTKGAKLLYGSYNSPAENAFLYGILSLLVTLEFIIFAKLGWTKKGIFLAFMLPNIIIGAYGWLAIHDLVAQDNSIRQKSHLFFGAEISASVLTTGTIIYPEVRHFINNLFTTLIDQQSGFGRGIAIASFTGLTILFGIINIALYTKKSA